MYFEISAPLEGTQAEHRTGFPEVGISNWAASAWGLIRVIVSLLRTNLYIDGHGSPPKVAIEFLALFFFLFEFYSQQMAISSATMSEVKGSGCTFAGAVRSKNNLRHSLCVGTLLLTPNL